MTFWRNLPLAPVPEPGSAPRGATPSGARGVAQQWFLEQRFLARDALSDLHLEDRESYTAEESRFGGMLRCGRLRVPWERPHQSEATGPQRTGPICAMQSGGSTGRGPREQATESPRGLHGEAARKRVLCHKGSRGGAVNDSATSVAICKSKADGKVL